jgi:hypothetical protein
MRVTFSVSPSSLTYEYYRVAGVSFDDIRFTLRRGNVNAQ